MLVYIPNHYKTKIPIKDANIITTSATQLGVEQADGPSSLLLTVCILAAKRLIRRQFSELAHYEDSVLIQRMVL